MLLPEEPWGVKRRLRSMRVGGASEGFLEERDSRVGVGEGTGDKEARTGRMPTVASHPPVNTVEDR